MSAHSPLGPSSAHRWMACPGSVAATASIPDKATSYSIEGTAAHTLTEWARLRDRPPSDWLGETVVTKRDGESYGVLIDQAMVDAATTFVDFVNDIPGEAIVEARVSFDPWVPGGFGTADDIRLADGVVAVTDFKYGQGVRVDAARNVQMMLYALGVYHEYGYLYAIERFDLHVVQPRLDHIDSWSISVEELLYWAEKELRPAAEATCKPDAPFKAGDWCQFCRIRSTCRTRAEAVFAATSGDFDNLDDAVAKAGKRGTLTNDEIAVVLTAIPQIEKWVKDIEAHAMAEIQHGRAVGDYKLVEGRGGRDWGFPDDELKKVWVAQGLDPLALYESKVLTPAKAEKFAGKKADLWKVNGLVVKTRGKPTLAPGSDKRPPITVSAETEFENLEENAD